jgi:hypothetical protein
MISEPGQFVIGKNEQKPVLSKDSRQDGLAVRT